MHFFEMLGSKITNGWQREGFDEQRFADIATAVLTSYPPNEHTSFDDVVVAALNDPSPAQQFDDSEAFGQPPLTVFMGRDFHIEVLFWTLGLPGIHQHAFSGAFHVLEGSSLHTEYEWTTSRQLASRLLEGQLTLQSMKVLKKGSTCPIRCGSTFIHSTFHLDRPSVTVVVRTNRETQHLPQYIYVPPGLAFDPHELPPLIQKRLQLLRMLLASNNLEQFRRAFEKIASHNDSVAQWYYLSSLQSLLSEKSLSNLLTLIAKHDDRRAVLFQQCLTFLYRRKSILSMRAQPNAKDISLLLAAMLYARDPVKVVALAQNSFEREGAAALLRTWQAELMNGDWKAGPLSSEFEDIEVYITKSLLNDVI